MWLINLCTEQNIQYDLTGYYWKHNQLWGGITYFIQCIAFIFIPQQFAYDYIFHIFL